MAMNHLKLIRMQTAFDLGGIRTLTEVIEPFWINGQPPQLRNMACTVVNFSQFDCRSRTSASIKQNPPTTRGTYKWLRSLNWQI